MLGATLLPHLFVYLFVIGMDMCDAYIFQWCRINYHTKIFWRSSHPRVGQVRAPSGWLLCSCDRPPTFFKRFLTFWQNRVLGWSWSCPVPALERAISLCTYYERIQTCFRGHEFIPVTTISVHPTGSSLPSVFACPFVLCGSPGSNTFKMEWDLPAVRDAPWNVNL